MVFSVLSPLCNKRSTKHVWKIIFWKGGNSDLKILWCSISWYVIYGHQSNLSIPPLPLFLSWNSSSPQKIRGESKKGVSRNDISDQILDSIARPLPPHQSLIEKVEINNASSFPNKPAYLLAMRKLPPRPRKWGPIQNDPGRWLKPISIRLDH